jgi:S1-C subfamily serine protease
MTFFCDLFIFDFQGGGSLRAVTPTNIVSAVGNVQNESSTIERTVQLNSANVSPSPQRSPARQRVTGSDLDFEIIKCDVNRRPDYQGIGLSLSTALNQPNRSLSRSSNEVALPIITNVEPNSPAELSGLKSGDLVLEINGKRTNEQPNSVISDWIKNSGSNIEFLVSRRKDDDAILKQNARIITETSINAASAQYATETVRLSRRDQDEISNRSGKVSTPSSPRIVYQQTQMSSSRLQETPPPKIRVQSEPPESDRQSPNKLQSQASPASRRSASSFTLPRDAPIPRLCRVRALEDQLGFTVAGSKTNPGVFKVSDIAVNSPAAQSGLRNEDYIIEISGVNVETMSYNEVINLIRSRKQEDDLQLLVAEKSVIEWYKSRKIPISSSTVSRMQYIETLLNDELQGQVNDRNSYSSEGEL